VGDEKEYLFGIQNNTDLLKVPVVHYKGGLAAELSKRSSMLA